MWIKLVGILRGGRHSFDSYSAGPADIGGEPYYDLSNGFIVDYESGYILVCPD